MSRFLVAPTYSIFPLLIGRCDRNIPETQKKFGIWAVYLEIYPVKT